MAAPTAAPAVEAASPFKVPSSHSAQRTIQGLIGLLIGLAVLQASLFVPGVARLFGLSVFDGIIVCTLVIVGYAAATTAYAISGFSRLYFHAEYVESVFAATAYLYMIYASGAPQSLFWFLYLAHVFVLGSAGTHFRDRLLLALGPAGVALAFAVSGQTAGAVVSLVAAVFGVALHPLVGRSFEKLEVLRRREAELKAKVASLRVAQERDRIARDLHDGVGAQLAGLIWRVRGLGTGRSAEAPDEIETLERRVHETIEELRDIVLALRREPLSWNEVLTLLTQRCREMCGTTRFELHSEGAPDPAMLPTAFPDFMRITFELVRNAVRHAASTQIEVRIKASGSLRLEVSDDGRGFESAVATQSQGGLRNVRQRVGDLGGRMEVASSARGTRVEIDLPAVQSGSERSTTVPSSSGTPDDDGEMRPSRPASRGWGRWSIVLAVSGFEASLFLPAVARVLGVSVAEGAVASALVIVGLAIATVAERAGWPFRRRVWAEYAEAVLIAAGYSYLLHAAGTPHSAFWFLYLFHVFALATLGTRFRHIVLIGLAPAAIALGFCVQAQIAAATATGVAGGFGLMVYLMIAKAFDEIEAARQREIELRAELAALSVSKERDRIARDLHDNVGAQLSALIVRVRGFTSRSTGALAAAELEILERRVLAAIEEMRDVVLALRRESLSGEGTFS
jgi:signal transduction histidine kinase